MSCHIFYVVLLNNFVNSNIYHESMEEGKKVRLIQARKPNKQFLGS
jgi:hypothetical protein